MDISIYGSTGFVGSAFCKFYEGRDDLWLVPKHSRRPDPYKKSDILYLISTTHNYNVMENASIDVQTNLIILTEALDSWRRNNPEGVFNFVSSWFVYGDHEGMVNEETPCNPKGFYSITKRCAEQLLISYAETFNLKYRIFRLCNILGKDDKNVSAKKNALQYLINKIKNNEPIEIYEYGKFYRNYMYIDDCVRAIKLLMENGELNSIYNVATDKPSMFIDLINYAYAKSNSTSLIEFIPQAEFHKKVQAKSFQMQVRKLYDLGFTPKYTDLQAIDKLL